MIIMSIYLAIILCYVILVCVTAFICSEISEEKREVKRMNNNLQIELDKLRHAVYDAYNEGYEKGRCEIKYMYGYDIN